MKHSNYNNLPSCISTHLPSLPVYLQEVVKPISQEVCCKFLVLFRRTFGNMDFSHRFTQILSKSFRKICNICSCVFCFQDFLILLHYWQQHVFVFSFLTILWSGMSGRAKVSYIEFNNCPWLRSAIKPIWKYYICCFFSTSRQQI